MVGNKHQDALKFAKDFLSSNIINENNFLYDNFREIERPSNLMKILKETSERTEGSIPDMLLISHDCQNINLSLDPPKIPKRILILWIEAVESSLQGFPNEKDVKEVLMRTLTWKELYDQKLFQEGLFGRGVKITQDLYDSFYQNMSEIYVKFYIVRNETIWECKQITK